MIVENASTQTLTEKDILNLIKKDSWMMLVLQTAADLNLPDWMIGAGFVRNKVWDFLHGFRKEQVDTADIDLIYFDKENLGEETEKEYDKILREKTNVNWSAKNQARMHFKHGDKPYSSTTDALAHWVETPTCVAVTLENGTLKLIAPYGIYDLVNLRVRPTPRHDVKTMLERVKAKKWKEKWPKIQIIPK